MDIRKIQADILEGNPLRAVKEPFTFYHDETNNIRKLVLTGAGLNNPEPKIFVLGGVVFRPTVTPDWSGLLGQLRLQASTKELKLTHLGKGDFLELVASKKLATFLKWLTQRKIQIHYTAVDVLYWSVVDIIDSVFANRLEDPRLVHHRRYKNLLYRVMTQDVAATAGRLFTANYPDVESGATRAFLEELIATVEASTAVLTVAQRQDLSALLHAGLDDAQLDFIQNGDRHVLIGGFEAFYRQTIATFKDSTHFLDKEDLVAEKLAQVPMTDGDKPYAGHQFLDSKADPGIQVADVVAGLLGKYWTYINRVDYDAMVTDMKGLTVAQLDTIGALRRALDESDRVSNGFLQTIICDDDVEKHRRFLWGYPRAT